MSKPPTWEQALLDSFVEHAQTADHVNAALLRLNLTTISLLIDENLVKREQVIERIEQFRDGMKEHHRDGRAANALNGVIDWLRADDQKRPMQPRFEVIEGGKEDPDQD